MVHCHCGCMELLQCEGGELESGKEDQNSTYTCIGWEWVNLYISVHNVLTSAPLPPLGLACYAYLLLSEGVQLSYLPCVLRSAYLLHSTLHHTTALLTRPEKLVVQKGQVST